MPKVELFGLKLPEVKPGDDLAKMISESAAQTAGGLDDSDVLILTAKIISKANGLLVELRNVKPSKRAVRIAKKAGGDPRYIQVVLDNSDQVLLTLPLYNLARKGLVDISKLTEDSAVAYEVLKKSPTALIVLRGSQIYSDAGIDSSNHPEDIVSIPPKDPDRSAREIRTQISDLTDKDVAVIISDTEIWPSQGSIDFARGSSGIQVTTKKFGRLDRYGKPKFGGVDFVAQELACAAALLMGQTDEGLPVVLVRGYKYVRSDEGISTRAFKPSAFRAAARETVRQTIRILGLRWLLKTLI